MDFLTVARTGLFRQLSSVNLIHNYKLEVAQGVAYWPWYVGHMLLVFVLCSLVSILVLPVPVRRCDLDCLIFSFLHHVHGTALFVSPLTPQVVPGLSVGLLGAWIYKVWPDSSFIFNRELRIADHY